MYEVVWTQEAAAKYAQLKAAAEAAIASRRQSKRRKSTKAQGLFKQVHKCTTFLLSNPRHPGLCTHEYHSLEHPYEPGGKVFEPYVQNRTAGAYRLFWCYGPDKKQITLLAITPHPWGDAGRPHQVEGASARRCWTSSASHALISD